MHHRLFVAVVAVVAVAGCKPVDVQRERPDAHGAGKADAGSGSGSADSGSTVDAAPTCNGAEPCAVHPVMTPPGYTVVPYLQVTNYANDMTCAAFADCDMWNTHYTSNWNDPNGQPVNPYYSKMGSPFPWSLARYTIEIPPKAIEYAKFHVAARGDAYVYGDNTREMQVDRTTGAATCFKRSTSALQYAWMADLGGTNVLGRSKWTISVLPGDMGDSGNVSACQGVTGWNYVVVTFDPAYAASHPGSCLLREGHDYYFNAEAIDCGTHPQCTFGWQLMNATTEDNGPLLDAIACR